MSITIKELEKPSLGRVKMNCDSVIHEKLERFPMVKDCFSTNHFTVIVGKMGQGKTSLAVSLIKKVMPKCYENIYVVMPEASRRSIDNDIFGKNLPGDQLYDDLNDEVLDDLYAKINENCENGENSLLLIDDFQQRFKNPAVSQGMEKLINKQRHLHLTCILLQQNFQKLPKPLRELACNIICFNIGKSQLEKIFEEVMQMTRDKYEQIIHFAFQETHDWICINLHKSKNIYKMFDQIIF